jgi:broad specificity phosphatase PhoE
MTRIVLIRHGETDWNVEGRYQGQSDPPLNIRGLEQARFLAEKLRPLHLEVLYTSPLLRAAQTAQIIADRLGIAVHLEPRLMEIHQGEWQTRLRSEIEALYPELFQRWEAEPWQTSPPNGETLEAVQARVSAAVREILTRHPGARTGLVSHRIPIALIKIQYQGLKADIIRNLSLPNTYFEEIIFPDGGEKTVARQEPDTRTG